MMNHQQQITRYLNAWIDAMVLCDVHEVVISPGSRSTPLALLFQEREEITTYIDVDERSAGFLALGLAKAQRKPVALLCTSGTAAANYYPAIVEAKLSRVPLVVLTADRPYELQNVGAAQTIGQENLYGIHVKGFYQLQIPESSLDLIHYNQMIAARAIELACDKPQGPVHLNFPFREPLLPDLTAEPQGTQSLVPLIHSGVRTLSEKEMTVSAASLNHAKRGVIVCGPSDSMDYLKSVVSLSATTGFPILADPLSQLRCGDWSHNLIIESYDTFLRNETAVSLLEADFILRFGAMPVSKSLMQWLNRQKAEYWVVDSGGGWRDPTGRATQMFYCDERIFCEQLCEKLDQKQSGFWQILWQKLNRLTQSVLQDVTESEALTEETAYIDCLHLFPERSVVFAGNSMPIRMLDTFLAGSQKQLTIQANRGANGIDGVVSTAVGVSLVNPGTYLMIGDLSFFHDMNGLLAARQLKADLTIILINNDGGGIFSFLPQAAEAKHFETLFGTPHGLEFAHSAALYGAFYRKAATRNELEEAMVEAADHHGLSLIEIPTQRSENVVARRVIADRLEQLIGTVLAGESR